MIYTKIGEIKLALSEQISLEKNKENIGVLAGYSGTSLFYYGNYLLTGDEECLKIIETIIGESFSKINNMVLSPYFCNGLAGFAYLLNFYKTNGIIEIDDDLQENINEINGYLLHSFKHALNVENLDFLHGSEGLMQYFLSLNATIDVCDPFVNRLNKLKVEIHNKGVAWKSNVSYKEGNKLVYNLGLAHGMASTLIILSKIVKTEKVSVKQLAKNLLARSVDFYLSEKLDSNFISSFPNYSSLDEEPSYSRLGWCYGDLGISVALWSAGDALQDSNIKLEATNILLKTTKRKTQEATGVVDAAICHGTAGISYIYQKMYGLTENVEFKVAADYWLQETLNMAKYHDGLAGYKTWSIDGNKNEFNLLEGVSGIGMVLISSQIKNLAWDGCLLLN